MAERPSSRDKFPRKFGKYHLLAPLAQGGMGALYIAVAGERGLERLMVIKTVLPHLADKEYVARFRDEAKVVVKLSHGNIIPVFDAGQVGGELFIAMEFLEGRDLRAVWNRCAQKQVAFPIDVAAYIVKELARGLHYAHSFGDLALVHRDVSPPNALISYAGEVKLTDFGLASSNLKLEKTAPGIIYGKVAYMSPEQARGEPLDGRSDIYAAGIILWELLTGRQLFPPSKEQPKDLLARAKDPEVPPPSKRAPRVPPELDAIVARALAPEKKDRYQSGDDLRDALSGWLAANAPGTDQSRLSEFVSDLFVEDIGTERAEREAMIAQITERAMTLPPTDELRQLLEPRGADRREAMRVESPGRRAGDRGLPGFDRRGSSADVVGVRTRRGVAVDVPAAGPGGATAIRPGTTSGAVASAEAAASQATLTDSAALHADEPEIVGSIIDGRYQVLELIGEGGMGRVYLAEHVEIGKRVAVKVLHPVYSRMPELVERFRREARAASRIGHPNIVDVTDSGTTADEQVYFVMEYLEGVELAAVVDREGALSVTRSLDIAAQICRALSAAHSVGVIHRDLKPENVFLTSRGGTSDFVKVLDFGIAKSAEAEEARAQRLTHPGMAMGTPEYMAPEQAAGQPADARSDVYAVGAILYEVLTGVAPYQGDNFMEILSKKATRDPKPPRELRPELPVEVDALVMEAMSRSPDDRPPSMEAFEYELTKCLQGRGAAVAQMLGMAGIAAAQPPQALSVRPSNEAAERAARAARDQGARRDSGESAADDWLPEATLDASSSALAAAPAAARESAGTDMVGTAGGPSQRLARAGWLALSAALVLGLGALAMTAAGEQTAREQETASIPPRQVASAKVQPAPEAVAAEARGIEAVQRAVDEAAGDNAAADADVAGDSASAAEAANGSDERGDRSGKNDDKSANLTRQASPRGKPAGTPESRSASKPAGKAADSRSDRLRGTRPPRNSREAKAILREARGAVARLQWARARRGFERVASGKHERAEGLLGIADVLFQTGNYNGAIEFAQKALRVGGGDQARKQLGHAHLKKGDYARAAAFYEAVLARRPGDKEAKSALRVAKRKLKQ